MIDPFTHDSDAPLNIATGVVLPEDVAQKLINSTDIDRQQMNAFVENRINSNAVGFWEPIPNTRINTFSSIDKKIRVKSSDKLVAVNVWQDLNPRSLLAKIVTRSLEGGEGQSDPPPSSTFDTIHSIELKFGTYSKLHLYFQLSEITWCLIGFHGNISQINDVTGGRHLGFSNFQILFKFSLLYLRLTGEQHLAVEIYEIGLIHCEIVII